MLVLFALHNVGAAFFTPFILYCLYIWCMLYFFTTHSKCDPVHHSIKWNILYCIIYRHGNEQKWLWSAKGVDSGRHCTTAKLKLKKRL